MALVGVELETLVSESDALTTRRVLLDRISADKCMWPDFRTMNIP